jgi:transposase-like protein
MAEIISHAVWLYHVFSLSLRDVELILSERGIRVTHESIRRWGLKFGPEFATRMRRRRPRPGDTWHLDEVYLRINGQLHYLWRAVDQHGVVLDILVQERRNATAAKRFFSRLLKGLRYKPRRLVTDGLRSYGVAHRELLPDVRHRTSRYLNNPSAKLPPADAPARAVDATVQVIPAGTAVPVIARHDLRSFPPSAAPDEGRPVSPRSRQSLPDLASGDVRPSGKIIRHALARVAEPSSTLGKLAMPRWMIIDVQRLKLDVG